jgi:hypothetical protein
MPMSFPVHPTEAQAMQEDETQLLSAIAHTTRSAISFLNQSKSPIQPKPESPQIHMNGRMIYGAMANGQFRKELTGERLRIILDALQNPATEGIDPKRYKGKTAAIQIRDAGIILFRQEQDGVITVNQFQQEQQQEPKSKSSELEIN